MNPLLVNSIVVLGFGIAFALFWKSSRKELVAAASLIREKEQLAEELKSKLVRMVDEAGGKRAESEASGARALREAEESLVQLKAKYSGVIDQELMLDLLRKEANELTGRIEQLRQSYSQKRHLLDDLEEQVGVYENRIELIELGVYEPCFHFRDSEEYKNAILDVRDRQKQMIMSKSAVQCTTDWVVAGSKSKGEVMVARLTRLTLRAFNNECEAAIANTRWNNVLAMEKRIRSSEQSINKENASFHLILNPRYVSLKVEELRLTHESRERLKVEKEERLEMARAEREEKKLLAEAEAAEKEERKYASLLEKARREVGSDEASEEMKSRIVTLEAALKEAHEAGARARAMAEMTKSGYVYIISNVGSFGGDVVKIGLTRRLEPEDRIRELGDASVPFEFDTHAIIYSDDAPSLESALHREFADRRINMSNMRKEFFCVGLDEVQEAVQRLAPSASFFKDREAQEWHETLARRKQMLEAIQATVPELPREI